MRKAFIIGLLALLGACTHLGDPRLLAVAPVEVRVPSAEYINGTYRMKGTGVSHIAIMFGGGTIFDGEGKEGTLKLLCASMISGGIVGLGPEKTEQIIDDLSIDISISPEREYTLVRAAFLEEDAYQACQLLVGILKRPSLDNGRIELQRSILTDGIVRQQQQTMTVAFDVFREHYYRGDPRSHKVTPATLRSISRQDLVRAHQKIFIHKPLIGVIGNVDQQLIDELYHSFDSERAAVQVGMPADPEFGSFETNAVEKQCVLVMAHGAPMIEHEIHAASVIANHIIGAGGFGSRLVKEIRTKMGLAYSSGSFYQARPIWAIFGIYVVTEPENGQAVRKAVDEVLQGINKGITVKEMEWARQAVMNSYAVKYTNPNVILERFLEMDYYDIDPDYDLRFLDQLSKVSLLDVQAAADNLIAGPWVEVLVNSNHSIDQADE